MKLVITGISFCEYLIQQANALAANGHSVLLVMPGTLVGSTVGPEFEGLLVEGVEYYTYDIKARCGLRLYEGLRRRVSAFNPDVLHVHDNGELETFALISLFYRTPLVVTVHDVTTHPGADSELKLRRKLIKQVLLFRANIVHLHSEKLRTLFLKLHPTFAGKTSVIPHGTLSLFAHWEREPVDREPLTCLFFGRMEKYRGLDNLLQIAEMLKCDVPEIKIIVAGTGSELVKYKKQFEELGVFEIHDAFIPNSDVCRFFRRASLLFLPYHEASQSGVVLMGLPFGVPVVATDVGSISQVVANGVHGTVVNATDLRGFATAALELLHNTSTRDKMADACLELGQKLSFQNISNDFISMYSGLVKSSVD